MLIVPRFGPKHPGSAVAVPAESGEISFTSAIDGKQAQIQINILKAPVRAGCKRFTPAQWRFGLKGWENVTAMKWTVEGVWEEYIKQEDKLECARFNQSCFMN